MFIFTLTNCTSINTLRDGTRLRGENLSDIKHETFTIASEGGHKIRAIIEYRIDEKSNTVAGCFISCTLKNIGNIDLLYNGLYYKYGYISKLEMDELNFFEKQRVIHWRPKLVFEIETKHGKLIEKKFTYRENLMVGETSEPKQLRLLFSQLSCKNCASIKPVWIF